MKKTYCVFRVIPTRTAIVQKMEDDLMKTSAGPAFCRRDWGGISGAGGRLKRQDNLL